MPDVPVKADKGLVPVGDPTPRDGAGMRSMRAMTLFRACGITLWTLWLLVTNLHHLFARRGMPARVTMRWHKGVCRIAGIDVHQHGRPALGEGVLMVSNHVSYIDIIALGAKLPCSFVAKSEVAGWPVFGWLAKLQRTIFVVRDPRKAAEQMAPLRARLDDRESCVILFPEGTSYDGERIGPFKSSLFQAAEIHPRDGDGTVLVQPVSIAYTRLDGMPMGRAFRPLYAWYGDMELMSHLAGWLGIGRVGIDIIYHEPMRLGDFSSRKALAAACQSAVARGVETARRGVPRIEMKPSSA